jgi:hypothetical protein
MAVGEFAPRFATVEVLPHAEQLVDIAAADCLRRGCESPFS